MIIFSLACVATFGDEIKPGISRTPNSRFKNLPGYDFQPSYQYINGYGIHYLHKAPANAPAVLLSHGEPNWSYLYRKMIPVFIKAGYRTIAPDLLGFGKSDKPADQADYSYAGQVHIITQWLKNL